jgi:hypothetical protein
MKYIAVLLLGAILVGGCIIVSDVKYREAGGSSQAGARVSTPENPQPVLGETDIAVSTRDLPPNAAR